MANFTPHREKDERNFRNLAIRELIDNIVDTVTSYSYEKLEGSIDFDLSRVQIVPSSSINFHETISPYQIPRTFAQTVKFDLDSSFVESVSQFVLDSQSRIFEDSKISRNELASSQSVIGTFADSSNDHLNQLYDEMIRDGLRNIMVLVQKRLDLGRNNQSLVENKSTTEDLCWLNPGCAKKAIEYIVKEIYYIQTGLENAVRKPEQPTQFEMTNESSEFVIGIHKPEMHSKHYLESHVLHPGNLTKSAESVHSLSFIVPQSSIFDSDYHIFESTEHSFHNPNVHIYDMTEEEKDNHEVVLEYTIPEIQRPRLLYPYQEQIPGVNRENMKLLPYCKKYSGNMNGPTIMKISEKCQRINTDQVMNLARQRLGSEPDVRGNEDYQDMEFGKVIEPFFNSRHQISTDPSSSDLTNKVKKICNYYRNIVISPMNQIQIESIVDTTNRIFHDGEIKFTMKLDNQCSNCFKIRKTQQDNLNYKHIVPFPSNLEINEPMKSDTNAVFESFNHFQNEFDSIDICDIDSPWSFDITDFNFMKKDKEKYIRKTQSSPSSYLARHYHEKVDLTENRRFENVDYRPLVDKQSTTLEDSSYQQKSKEENYYTRKTSAYPAIVPKTPVSFQSINNPSGEMDEPFYEFRTELSLRPSKELEPYKNSFGEVIQFNVLESSMRDSMEDSIYDNIDTIDDENALDEDNLSQLKLHDDEFSEIFDEILLNERILKPISFTPSKYTNQNQSIVEIPEEDIYTPVRIISTETNRPSNIALNESSISRETSSEEEVYIYVPKLSGNLTRKGAHRSIPSLENQSNNVSCKTSLHHIKHDAKGPHFYHPKQYISNYKDIYSAENRDEIKGTSFEKQYPIISEKPTIKEAMVKNKIQVTKVPTGDKASCVVVGLDPSRKCRYHQNNMSGLPYPNLGQENEGAKKRFQKEFLEWYSRRVSKNANQLPNESKTFPISSDLDIRTLHQVYKMADQEFEYLNAHRPGTSRLQDDIKFSNCEKYFSQPDVLIADANEFGYTRFVDQQTNLHSNESSEKLISIIYPNKEDL